MKALARLLLSVLVVVPFVATVALLIALIWFTSLQGLTIGRALGLAAIGAVGLTLMVLFPRWLRDPIFRLPPRYQEGRDSHPGITTFFALLGVYAALLVLAVALYLMWS